MASSSRARCSRSMTTAARTRASCGDASSRRGHHELAEGAFVASDLPYLEGASLARKPFVERRRRLASVMPRLGALRRRAAAWSARARRWLGPWPRWDSAPSPRGASMATGEPVPPATPGCELRLQRTTAPRRRAPSWSCWRRCRSSGLSRRRRLEPVGRDLTPAAHRPALQDLVHDALGEVARRAPRRTCSRQ